MRRMTMGLFFLGCVALSGCGGSSNVCEEVLSFTYSVWDEACSGKADECCFCKCWLSGRKFSDYDETTKACECTVALPTAVPDQYCDEQTASQAEQCLADETLCRTGLEQSVNNPGYGQCTNSPL